VLAVPLSDLDLIMDDAIEIYKLKFGHYKSSSAGMGVK
jgi:hypothetical protein